MTDAADPPDDVIHLEAWRAARALREAEALSEGRAETPADPGNALERRPLRHRTHWPLGRPPQRDHRQGYRNVYWLIETPANPRRRPPTLAEWRAQQPIRDEQRRKRYEAAEREALEWNARMIASGRLRDAPAAPRAPELVWSQDQSSASPPTAPRNPPPLSLVSSRGRTSAPAPGTPEDDRPR